MNAVDERRRWFGMLFLILAGAILIWGQTILKPWLSGNPVAFIIYWTGCFGFTGLAILVALLDVWAVRRRIRNERKELLKRTLVDLQTLGKQAPKETDEP